MPIKTVVLDFGNVVGFFDHRRTSARLTAYSRLKQEDLHARLYDGELEHAYECGRISSDIFFSNARDLCQLTCTQEEFVAAWTDIFWPNPDVCQLIPELKERYCLILGSNTNEWHSLQFRRQFADTLRHFDHLVLSHEVGARKPDAVFFRRCEQLSKSSPEECLFVDDFLINVQGARSLGWNAIHYTSSDPLRSLLREQGLL